MKKEHSSQKHPQEEKEIHLLADILALILDKENGEAENALKYLRRRAEKSKLTGGALKNLFLHLAEKYHIATPETSSQKNENNQKLTQRIRVLERKQYDLQTIIRNLELHIEELYHDNASFYYRGSYQNIIIFIAIIFGIFFGLALSKFF